MYNTISMFFSCFLFLLLSPFGFHLPFFGLVMKLSDESCIRVTIPGVMDRRYSGQLEGSGQCFWFVSFSLRASSGYRSLFKAFLEFLYFLLCSCLDVEMQVWVWTIHRSLMSNSCSGSSDSKTHSYDESEQSGQIEGDSARSSTRSA
jgi:hypothetical protein